MEWHGNAPASCELGSELGLELDSQPEIIAVDIEITCAAEAKGTPDGAKFLFVYRVNMGIALGVIGRVPVQQREPSKLRKPSQLKEIRDVPHH